MKNFQIKPFPNLLVLLSFLGILFLAGCSNRSCKIPAFVLKNVARYANVAEELLLNPDSIYVKIQGYYYWNSSHNKFELLNSNFRQTNNNSNTLVDDLLDLKVTQFRIVNNNVFFYYEYDSNFFRGNTIYRYVVFENTPIDFTNPEGDQSWDILCNEQLSDKIKHIVEYETI